MSVAMHTFSAPVFARMLENLLTWLDRAETFAQAKGFEVDVLLGARLAPDMLPFARQIQIACDAAKFGVARLAGVDAPAFADDEKTFGELRERVRRTLDFVRSVPAAKLAGSEEREVEVPHRAGAAKFRGEDFLTRLSLPNFFFHATMTYALLRHNGVELGKMDYLGPMPLPPVGGEAGPGAGIRRPPRGAGARLDSRRPRASGCGAKGDPWPVAPPSGSSRGVRALRSRGASSIGVGC